MAVFSLWLIPFANCQNPVLGAEITGPNYICNAECDYTLTNTIGMTVTVMVTQNFGIITTGGNTTNIYTAANCTTFHVQWDPSQFGPPYYATITVSVSNGIGDPTITTFNVYQCCYWYGAVDHFFDRNLQTITFGANIDPLNPLATYQIFGTLTILPNQTVTLNDAHFYMSEQARIIVSPGATLIIRNSTLQHPDECQKMWDGIYVTDQTASLIINGSSYIRDAVNAVVSKNNGAFQISDSYFQNNYIGLSVSDFYAGNPTNFNPPYNGSIINTTFECNTSNNLLQYSPKQNMQAFSGVSIEKVDGIVIGDINKTTPQNKFLYLRNGIYARSSDIESYNNDFEDIFLYPMVESPSPLSAGINAKHMNNVQINFQPKLIVNDPILNGFGGNSFKNCFCGVENYNQIATINLCKYEDCANPIFCENTVSPTSITSNTINYPPANYIFQDGAGIFISNAFPSSNGINLNVFDNKSFDMRTGISLINQQGTNNNFPTVNTNHVTWSNSSVNPLRTGINVENCNNIDVSRNLVIQMNSYAYGYNPPEHRGIRISQSQNATVESNYIYDMESGIYTNGSILNTQFLCNTLEHCFAGFYFGLNTALSTQGGPWDQNCWVPNNRFIGYYSVPNSEKMNQLIINSTPVVHGIINAPNTVYWAFNYGDPEFELDPDLNQFPGPHHCYSYITGVSKKGCNIPCSNLLPHHFFNFSDTTQRENLFGQILRNEYNYDTLTGQFKWYEKEYLYHSIQNDTNMINLGGYNDYRYQQVFDSLQNGSTGQVVKLNSYIETAQYDLASAQNDLLLENQVWVSNIKIATQIYLNTWAQGLQVLSAEDSTTLLPIALSTPYEGGPGVYTARFMLGIHPENNNVPYHTLIQAETSTSDYTIYPNPASDIILIQFKNLMQTEAILEFYNIAGDKVCSVPVNLSSNETSVSIKNIKSGVYFCRIIASGLKTKVQKLVIIK